MNGVHELHQLLNNNTDVLLTEGDSK